MENLELNNLKDYLKLFNGLSEKCFKRCVYTLGQISMTSDEASCVETCITKNINVNQKMLGLYVDINPQFQERKYKEQQEQVNKLLEAEEQKQIAEQVKQESEPKA